MALLVLTEPGESVIVGGDFDVVGTSAANDRVEIISGSIRLDASFNRGGDTISLPDAPSDYVLTISGSRATLAHDDGLTISIPLGANTIDLEFRFDSNDDDDDASYAFRVNNQGQLLFGDTVVTSGDRLPEAAAAQSWAKSEMVPDMSAAADFQLLDMPSMLVPELIQSGGADFHIV